MFEQQLEEVCPSLDASVKRPRRESPTVDDIIKELDYLNHRYSNLVELLKEHVSSVTSPQTETVQVRLKEKKTK